MAQPAHAPDFPAWWPPAEWTEAHLDLLPDDGCKYEIVDGALVVTPPPIDDHQSVEFALARHLYRAAPTGWRVLTNIGVRTPAGNLIPDVAVLRPGATRGVIWREAGDVALVVEVASKSTETYDKTGKAAAYAEAGIPSYWRVKQDGTVYVRVLDDEGQYYVLTVVKPGSTWEAPAPFPVVINPEELVAD